MAESPCRVLVADKVADEGLEVLRRVGEVDVITGLSESELRDIIGDYEALVVRSDTRVTRPVLEAAVKLQVVGRAGVGIDNIDVDAATERGVVVVNAPQGNTIAATEHTISLILATARHIPQADASLRSGEWRRKEFLGTELRGKTLGVLGLGNIGYEVARRAIAFEMRVIAFDPFVSTEKAASIGVESATVDEIISGSDFITVHLPLNDTTRGMIGIAEIERMKPDVRLINVARGGIIDEHALVAGVKTGKVAGAAIDVFTAEPPGPDVPLFDDPRIIVTPHLGASTAEAQGRVAVDVADQIEDVLSGRAARYAVNAPILSPEAIKVLGPYLGLCEMLGTIATRLVSGTLGPIEIDFFGEIAEHDVTPLRASVIKGLLKPISEKTVNMVNASLIASARGWRIEERLNSSHDVFHNLIRVRVDTGDAEISVGGTMLHGRAHIVRINGLDVDIAPPDAGILLVCDNDDRPGMIGTLGTILGA
ncbi:MAG: phosphoglycerate dehydrogenase, partial [Pirellulaceae bacterium]|nr:phosphoglycerate dehydrogenase [Pirellulaceae bacterium]